MKIKLACLAALFASLGVTAQAAPVYLDLTSGAFSVQNGAPILYDTYVEDGFRIRMSRAGDHLDPGFIGDIGFHNGPLNDDDIMWILDFGGAAFNLVDINIAGFVNGAASMTLTGSNGASQTVSALSTTAIAGMGNVTFVTFDLDQDGGVQAVGMSAINVDTTPRGDVPLPGSIALLGLGAAAMVAGRRRT
jgi:hypothetical protein